MSLLDPVTMPPPRSAPQAGTTDGDAHAARYAALVARDARFDGRLYVGVTSTGIYCRPVCRVRTPKSAHCRFFAHPAAAEAAGFRPCLRCRPERAPGQGPIDMGSRLAWAAAQRIEAGELDDGGLGQLARRMGISDRHLRRVFNDAFGVTPVDYAQTQRLLMAKRLLADTSLALTDVAMAAGFGSLRRFNALFQSRYGLTPGSLRRRTAQPCAEGEAMRFELGVRPPFDWPRLLAFLGGRCIAGVEQVEGQTYRRTVRMTQGGVAHTGWLSLQWAPERHVVVATVSASLLRALPAVLAAARRLGDLACDPQAVAQTLGPLAAAAPGLRVPGAFDGFEMAVRAILGQQVTVKAAHTLAGRLAQTLGTPVVSPWPALTHLFPEAGLVAATPPEALRALGVVSARAAAIVALAREVHEGRLELGPTADVDRTLAQLRTLPGIGPWTAQYIALRALSWPDAWPTGDVVLIKALGVSRARDADAHAEAWRPWRGYAALHLWRQASETPEEIAP